MESHFLEDETGAVTVDWVVLSAGLVGLGLAAASVVSAGVENQSTDVAQHLADMEIGISFSRVFLSEDFANGRGDWIGGELRTINGFGEVLALSRRANMAQLPINIGDDHQYAAVQFDMIIGDSWDNEQGAIQINGTDVVIASHHWRNDAPAIQTFDGSDNTKVTLTRVSTQTGGSWRPGQEDYTYNVQILTANDGSDMTIGASTNLDQNAGDEFFAIDNVSVRGTNQR